MTLLDDLNPHQREAVLTTEGPLLVVAGAGTGKTRVITYRVAYLIEQGAPQQSILAVTFTNKAADQMKDRIARLLQATGHAPSEVWISTFHSFCARLLRRESPRIGLPRDYSIYNDDDQIGAIKLALQELDYEGRSYAPRSLRESISFAKNHQMTPDDMAAGAYDSLSRATAEIYRAYERILQKASALDFDDLLLRAVELLASHREARAAWSARFGYIHVDEYQDTNYAQAELVRLLANEQKNVCVVGDEDQSIYAWRGALPSNMQRFLEKFAETRVVRLEENYRSTQTILDAAAAVVAHNRQRLGKELRATRSTGARLRFFEAPDSAAEADFICSQINQLVRSDSKAHIAVLYRTTAQSRSFEEGLRRLGIRHRVVGGFSFYQRAEVRDALAYVRLVLHPEDDVALLRIVNVPPRGIGKVTLEGLRARAQQDGASLWKAIEALPRSAGSVALRQFRKLIEGLGQECSELAPAELLRKVLERSSYLDWVEQQDRLEHSSRAENLAELVNAMAEAAEQGQSLEELLDHAALVADADDYVEEVPVSLMTLHSAKGLEFDHVFLAGLEEGLFPHSRSLTSPADIEEERRLCYVGMTRAKDTLTLTRATYRRTYGNEQVRESTPSRFLNEIPVELLETAWGSASQAGETRRYEPDPDYAASQYRHKRFMTQQTRSAASNRPSSPRANSASSPPSNPLIGTRVRHPTYGVGTVLAVEGDGDDRKFTVSFLDYGTKKLLERYARLELV
jgi:DNA helicase-2/ATP-dependent DNA helicase PcrA